MKVYQTRRIQNRERVLLVIAGLFISLNQIGLIMVQGRRITAIWPVVVWVGCAIGLHRAANRQLPHRDPLLLPAILLLAGWGLNLIHRLLPAFADRQAYSMIFSTVVVVGLMYLPNDLLWLRRYRYTWLVMGLMLLAATILGGVNPGFAGGPKLWLGVAGVFYQPSELVKLLLTVFLASYLTDHWVTLRYDVFRIGRVRLPSLGFLAPMLLMWGVCVVILVWQRDLGAATLFFIIFMFMLYLASGQWIVLASAAILFIGAMAVAYQTFAVVALRINIWLDPFGGNAPDNQSFQVVQSLIAVGSGGIIGEGIGQGVPTFIPVVHSDLVFAAIAEEWGLVGVVGLVLNVLVIVLRGLRVAMKSQHRPFAAFLAAGLSIMIGTQSLLIIGGSLRLVPLTGVTLPFVSYGGSSLLTSFVAGGLLLILSEDSET